jgi:predicted secreted Zn-dependent protease
VNALFTALLLTAVAAGSDGAVIARLHVRIDAHDLSVSSCHDMVTGNPEPGLATIRYRYQIADTHRLANGEYGGTIVFELADVTVDVPRSIAWPEMTDADRARAEALRHAIVHHEIGHVRVAEAVRDALNTRAPIVAPDVFTFRADADAAGRAGFERFTREEREYDELTDHGRRQHDAPGALSGPDTVLHCNDSD